MTNRSRRGAARIGAVAVIIFAMLGLVAIVFAVISQQDMTTAEEARDVALADAAEADQKFVEQIEQTRLVSDVLGFRPIDPDTGQAVIGSTSDVEAAQQALSDFKGEFPDMDDAVRTYGDILPIVKAVHASKLTQIADLQQRVEDLQSQVTAAQAQTTKVGRDLQGQIDSLETQLADARSNATTTQASLQDRLDAATDDRNEKDSQLRSVRGDLDDAQRTLAQEQRSAQARMRLLTDKLRPVLREPEAADGEILDVSDKLPIGFIDRGTVDKILRGMVFEVRSGRPGQYDVIKGYAEVIDVMADMARVEFSNIADQFDPIAPGDQISNPLYDPEGQRNAVLAGRFTGTYSEADIKRLADQIGITIQPAVTADTDFLIVGGEIFLDEDGEPLEEPIQPNELAPYKDAEALGAQIISYRQLSQFFKR